MNKVGLRPLSKLDQQFSTSLKRRTEHRRRLLKKTLLGL